MQKINIGNQSNDGTGDSIREAFKKVNVNFQELYGVNNLGDGLYFTKLKDTPQHLIASSTTTPALILSDTFGGTLTQKLLVAGEGLVISNTQTGIITISNPNANLRTDQFPALGGNLNGNNFRAYDFADPVEAQQLATKNYVDNNGYFSKVNLFVSTNGRDVFPPDVPVERQGRAWQYAFKTINKAAQVAEAIINTSTNELSSYSQPVTLNNGASYAGVYSAASSDAIAGDTRIYINYSGYAGSDQWISKDIRPGQYIKGRYSQTLAFIDDLGHATGISIPGYNETTWRRDTGLAVDAIVQDLLFSTSSQTIFSGLEYWNYDPTQPGVNSTTTNAISHLKDLALRIIIGDSTSLIIPRYQSGISQTTSTNIATAVEQSVIETDFNVILNILTNGNVSSIKDSIVPNSLSTSTTATVQSAYLLLEANKDYLAAEVNAYVAHVYPTYVYNTTTFARSVRGFVDSVSFDLLWGGNRQAVQAGAYYWGYDGTSSAITGQTAQTAAAYSFISGIIDDIIIGNPIVSPQQIAVPQVTAMSTGTSAEYTIAQNLISGITSIINSGPGVATTRNLINLTASSTATVINAANILKANKAFIQAEVVAWVKTNYTSGIFEFYDVKLIDVPNRIGFTQGEPLDYTVSVPTSQISINIESGTYYEQLPIKIPANTSLKGDEFRRVIVRPDNGETGSSGYSTSKWAKIYFRRDNQFDGLTKSSNNNRTLLADPGNEYGFHYLQNSTDPTSSPRLNADMDIFLLNDATLIRGISGQGHGGFMCVLDPEGQILTKSPYIQNCSSFSKSINKQTFSGGIFADGFVGNLKSNPADATTYWTGTLTISVTGLSYRAPQTPFSFFVKGNRYEVDYVTGWTTTTGAAVLHLNPRAAGGLAIPVGTIAMWPSRDGGRGYSTVPNIIFSQPSEAGGFGIQGTGTINAAGTLTSITITNPGTGYTTDVSVTFVGGNPVASAPSFTISSSTLATGFIGQLPSQLNLGTAGNKSILAADFTQINDLGYGVVLTNTAQGENVSVFTYYNRTGYYACNGAQFRSLNGANAYGDYALKAEGADPNEVPTPVLLATDMVQTATAVYGIVNLSSGGTVNTVNTSSGSYLYVKGYTYSPYNQSEFDVDHGNLTDTQGNVLGVQTYQVVSVSTVSSVLGELAQLNLSNAASLFGSTVGGLKAPISSGTAITIRSNNVFRFTGINAATIVRPSTALQFTESTATTYRVLSYNSSGLAGDTKITLRDAFQYVALTSYPIWLPPQPGATVIKVSDLTSTEAARITSTTASTYTQLTFGWKGGIHKITKYETSSSLGQAYAQITITPALVATLTNLTSTSTGIAIKAGLRQYGRGEVTTRISTLRVSGHDLLNIGAGSAEASNIPNDIYGPSRGTISTVKERVEVGKGRVYAITTDQNGNFKVGDLFQVDQGSGNLVISGSLTLNQVDGLGFKRGDFVREFSNGVDDMVREGTDIVPTEYSVVSYVNKRLGLNRAGTAVTKIGSGYLDLTGVQSLTGTLKIAGNDIDMGTSQIFNLSTDTTGVSSVNIPNMAVNKAFVDMKVSLQGIDYKDPMTGFANTASGIMTGLLQLSRDPVSTDHFYTSVTKRYVDKQTRQFNTLTDVSVAPWPNLPQNGDFLMFNGVTVAVNTTSSTPVWNSATQITNVRTTSTSTVILNRSPDSASTAGATTYAWFSIRDNTLTNTHIWSNAAIDQSKLNMTAATTRANATGIVQANLGLASFNSTYFSATNGWIDLNNTTSFMVTAVAAKCTTSALSVTNGLCWGVGSDFNGSAASTIGTNATSGLTVSTLVCRDANGDFIARNVAVCSIIKCGTNGVGDLGQTGNKFGTVYANTLTASIVCGTNCVVAPTVCGTSYVYAATCMCAPTFCGNATSANYADLAERYRSDGVYPPCTVLEFGGTCEVTIAQYKSARVAGVVSTDPAYLMNGSLVGENTVALALTGRVPTMVRGPVRKGDMMVSAGDGYAQSDPNPSIGTVIGKALEDFDGKLGVIEVVVGRL